MQQGKILLVDDDGDFRSLVSTYLRRESFAVTEASTAGMARHEFGAADVDLVLLDLGLPDADGFDLLRDLRSQRSVPVIMLTGKDTPMDRILGLELEPTTISGNPSSWRNCGPASAPCCGARTGSPRSTWWRRPRCSRLRPGRS